MSLLPPTSSGIVRATVAPVTCGSAPTRSSSSLDERRRRAPRHSRRGADRSTRAGRCRIEKPGSTDPACDRLLANSDAQTSSTTDNPTCPTTSSWRSRPLAPRPCRRRLFQRDADLRARGAQRRHHARDNRRHDGQRRSRSRRPAHPCRRRSAAETASAARTRRASPTAQRARTRPARQPAADSSRFSTSIWRTTCQRLAPTASRTAISR